MDNFQNIEICSKFHTSQINFKIATYLRKILAELLINVNKILKFQMGSIPIQ